MGRRIQILAECPILAEIDVLSVLACPTAGQPLEATFRAEATKTARLCMAHTQRFFRIVASRWLRPRPEKQALSCLQEQLSCIGHHFMKDLNG